MRSNLSQQDANQNDGKLLADYLSGDESALNKIISNNLSMVYSAAFFMLGNGHDAEDVTQETFLKVWRHAKKYDQSKSFRTWLLAIARNTARDFLRKKKDLIFSDFENAEGGNFLTDTLADPEPLSDEIFRRREDKAALQKILAELSFSQREVVILRYTSNLTFEEIGQIVGRPLDTVKSQHRRAMLQIRKNFAPNHEV